MSSKGYKMIESIKHLIARKRVLETSKGFVPQVYNILMGWRYIDSQGNCWSEERNWSYDNTLEMARERFCVYSGKAHSYK